MFVIKTQRTKKKHLLVFSFIDIPHIWFSICLKVAFFLRFLKVSLYLKDSLLNVLRINFLLKNYQKTKLNSKRNKQNGSHSNRQTPTFTESLLAGNIEPITKQKTNSQLEVIVNDSVAFWQSSKSVDYSEKINWKKIYSRKQIHVLTCLTWFRKKCEIKWSVRRNKKEV